MTRRDRPTLPTRLRLAPIVSMALALASFGTLAAEPNFPITQKQRSTAQKVAQDGVPLSELAPDAPDSYTVKRHDTLWGISKIFLRSPWRWPELWGMNLEDIRNPHLIYPGQILYLDKTNGRARLRVGQPVAGDTVKLTPRTRGTDLAGPAIASIPFHLIEPFLNEAVVFNTNELDSAPRIVATQEGRVLLGRGDRAYVRGELGADTAYRIFRKPMPLKDPTTQEVLGYEAVYVGAAEYARPGETRTNSEGKEEIVPATFTITSVKQEANVGDRLAPVPPREFSNYAPHAPASDMSGQVVSMYGDALTAGQNQIVAINRGARDGVERGHVLALHHSGSKLIDKTDPNRARLRLPDERQGTLFVFRVFERVSYALILSAEMPVVVGDRFTQP